MSITVTCTQDGTWTARFGSLFATGRTRAEAEAELRRLLTASRKAA